MGQGLHGEESENLADRRVEVELVPFGRVSPQKRAQPADDFGGPLIVTADVVPASPRPYYRSRATCDGSRRGASW